MKKRKLRLILLLTGLALLIAVVGIIFVAILPAQNTAMLYSLVNGSSGGSVAAVYSTNTAVSAAVMSTSDAKARTPTPAPMGTLLPTPTLAPVLSMTPRYTATISPERSTSLPPTPSPAGTISQPVAEMKAGEIDDNKLWDQYLLYRRDFVQRHIPVHDVDVSERHVITVSSGQQMPVLGARVRIYGNQALLSDTYTYANGQTLFFPKAYPEAVNLTSFDVVVEKDGQTNRFTLNRTEQYKWPVTLNGLKSAPDRIKLDVLFLLDSTGSMVDEIAQLQSNILSISSQIEALPGRPDVRYGMVIYRDRGDAYVTRIYQFTPDIKHFQTDLRAVVAANGDDEPESVNQALHDAIHGVEWRDDTTVKLIFLVADAPPHLDYPDDYDYAREMVAATQQGIKVYSLAASGLNPQGEYIFRQLAQYTMGHFIFLTYEQENKGANVPSLDTSKPGSDTSMSVPKQDYTVELLDKLVLRLIRDELASLNGQ